MSTGTKKAWRGVSAGVSIEREGDDYVLYRGPLWEDLRFPAQGINPIGAVTDPAVDTATFPGTLLFSPSATNLIAGVAQLPHQWKRGSAIHPHIHWSKTTSAANGVVWEFCYSVADIGGTFGAYSAWIEGADVTAHSDTANKHAVTAWPTIDLSGMKESAILAWQIRRKHDAAGDTYGANARLWEFDLHYQTDKGGTVAEVPT